MAAELMRWDQLDPHTQAALDEQYRKELERVAGPGLTPGALDEYLEYRHRRPEAQITTYEEGQIRRLLRGKLDPSLLPDPTGEEEPRGRIEKFGSRTLHLTHFGTFLFILLAHVYVGLIALVIWLIATH